MTTLRQALSYSPTNLLLGTMAGIFVAIVWLANPLSVAIPLSAVLIFNTGFTMWYIERSKKVDQRVRELNHKVEQDHERLLKRVA